MGHGGNVKEELHFLKLVLSYPSAMFRQGINKMNDTDLQPDSK